MSFPTDVLRWDQFDISMKILYLFFIFDQFYHIKVFIILKFGKNKKTNKEIYTLITKNTTQTTYIFIERQPRRQQFSDKSLVDSFVVI